jgi:hypothetical protein
VKYATSRGSPLGKAISLTEAEEISASLKRLPADEQASARRAVADALFGSARRKARTAHWDWEATELLEAAVAPTSPPPPKADPGGEASEPAEDSFGKAELL